MQFPVDICSVVIFVLFNYSHRNTCYLNYSKLDFKRSLVDNYATLQFVK